MSPQFTLTYYVFMIFRELPALVAPAVSNCRASERCMFFCSSQMLDTIAINMSLKFLLASMILLIVKKFYAPKL